MHLPRLYIEEGLFTQIRAAASYEETFTQSSLPVPCGWLPLSVPGEGILPCGQVTEPHESLPSTPAKQQRERKDG